LWCIELFPNVDAVQFLIKEIWPIILKEIPAARLTIAGRHPSQQVHRLVNTLPSATLIVDPVSMKEIFLKAALIIVPLRIGGGTRIKILQAFSYGVPVVTTSIGISGISALDGEEVIIRDQANDIAKSCGGINSKYFSPQKTHFKSL
jgi:glycosyltransferase involved in cell wall biosynthesis